MKKAKVKPIRIGTKIRNGPGPNEITAIHTDTENHLGARLTDRVSRLQWEKRNIHAS
jgi:hypothetical protein